MTTAFAVEYTRALELARIRNCSSSCSSEKPVSLGSGSKALDYMHVGYGVVVSVAELESIHETLKI